MKLKLLSASCLALVFSGSAFAGMQDLKSSSDGNNDVFLPSEGSAALPPLGASSDAAMLDSGSAPASAGVTDAQTGSMLAAEGDYVPLPPLGASSDAAMLDSGSGYGAGRGVTDAQTGSMMAGDMKGDAPLPSLDASSDAGMPSSGSGYGAGRGLTDAHTGSMLAESSVKPDALKHPLPSTPAQDEPMASAASGELDKLEAELSGKEKITKAELAGYHAKLINELKPVVLGSKKPELAQKWLAVAERVNTLATSSKLGEQNGIVGNSANRIKRLAGKK